MEPIFQISYTRKTESLHGQDTYYKVFTPIAKEYMDKFGIEDEEDLPDYFITTTNLNYKQRIDVQAAWQQYIDASISSTVNVPNEFTVEQVENIYMLAWEKGLKGITIYRDGCARSGILITDKKSSPKVNKDETIQDRIERLQEEMDNLIVESLTANPDACPMCGGTLNHSGGCSICQDCAYSPCAI